MPVIFETAIRLVLPMPGMGGGSFCPDAYRGGVINLFRGSHPTLLLSYGTKTRRKPILLFRLSGLLLFRLADRQFSAGLFQLPPRITRFEPTTDALVIQWPPLQSTHFFEILLHRRIRYMPPMARRGLQTLFVSIALFAGSGHKAGISG